MATQLSFQIEVGGSIPTSPLQLRLKLITKETAALCYRSWHYLGDKDFVSGYNFGVYFDNQIWGAMTFHGISAPETGVGLFGLARNEQGGLWELGRLALNDMCPRNSESHSLAIAIRLLRKATPVRAIVTYADTAQGHRGTIYRASNFTYLGLTAPKADFYINGVIQERGKTSGIKGEWRPRPRKHCFVRVFDSTLLPVQKGTQGRV